MNMKHHIHSITFTVMFLAYTVGATFHINIGKSAKHQLTHKIEKKSHSKDVLTAEGTVTS